MLKLNEKMGNNFHVLLKEKLCGRALQINWVPILSERTLLIVNAIFRENVFGRAYCI